MGKRALKFSQLVVDSRVYFWKGIKGREDMAATKPFIYLISNLLIPICNDKTFNVQNISHLSLLRTPLMFK